MIALLLVALGGGVGAAARFVLDGEIRARTTGSFPWGTFTVNVLGSLVIGVVAGVILAAGAGAGAGALEPWRLALATGLCGGFTTFSTVSVETVRLAQSGRLRLALANALGTLVVTVGAVAASLALTMAVL